MKKTFAGIVTTLAMLFALLLAAPQCAVAATASTGAVPLWRLYNQWTGEHLYTTEAAEYTQLDTLGWSREGIAWMAPQASGTAVWRLYNPWSGDHLYTTSASEYQELVRYGWSGEGTVFFSAESDGVPIYRLYNPWLTAGTHLYTTSPAERNSLVRLGWQSEGTAFYGSAEEGSPILTDGWYQSTLANAAGHDYDALSSVRTSGSTWTLVGSLTYAQSENDLRWSGKLGPATWEVSVASDVELYGTGGDTDYHYPYTRAEFERVLQTPNIGLGLRFHVVGGRVVEARLMS